MKLMTFKYTKADGKTSDRALIVQNMPSECITGIDVSELSMEDQAMYAAEMQQLKDDYMDKILNLNKKFDMNHCYRQFKPSQMSEVVTEEI